LVGIGHSLGGTALLLTEAAWPGTFAGLICFEPILATGSDPELAASAARRRFKFTSQDEARERLASKPPLSHFAPDVLRDYVECAFLQEPAGGVRLRCLPETEAHIYRTAASSEWTSALPHVRCPVAFLRGAHSTVVSHESLAAATAMTPGGRLRELDDLGHLGPLESPSVFAGVVDQFVSELD
jgi:pimeloyl-ACP methyl ester carboxylesterase